MKPLLLLSIATLLPGLFATAQSFDDVIIQNRYVTCQDVNFNAAKIISALHQNNQTDSLYAFLDYWESKCGETEKIFRLRNLLNIKTANFDDDSVSNRLLSYLMVYRPYTDENFFFYRYTQNGTDYEQAQKSINAEILTVARSIEQTYTVDEQLIKDFYASADPTFSAIKNAAPAESKLRTLYDQRLKETLEMSELHFSFFAGSYSPFGKIDVFGSHPAFGIIGGIKKLRHNYDLVMDVRVGSSKDKYTVVYKGNTLTDDTWTNAYLGFEYTYDIIHRKKFRAGLSPGFGYNGVTALEADNDYGEDAKTLSSYDANAGIVLKHLVGKSGYIGLHVRYHWVDYRNAGGTELNGNYLAIRLVGGWHYNFERTRRLKLLE